MLIVDTGVLVAAADRSDRYHQRCVELISNTSGPLVTTAMVVAEAAYLVARELGPPVERLLYDSITAGGLVVESLTHEDWTRIGELVATYDDLPLGGTDASIITIAERLNQPVIGTLDHRHFSVVRPEHVDALELVP